VAPATDDSGAKALDDLRLEVAACTRCALHETRTQAVFGEGDPHADLMFVGEAPGYHEDQQGKPFVGQAGKLLEQLLATIGLTRSQVFIANVLKSRPPGNRDPQPEEISACEPYLLRQIELIAPRVICTLGNFATKLLSGSQTGITRVHGVPQRTTLGGRQVYLYPVFHPAAALYAPANLAALKEDVLRLPEVLALPLDDDAGRTVAPDIAARVEAAPFEPPAPAATAPSTPPPSSPPAASGPAGQLGLF
jgi:DNA polymerase